MGIRVACSAILVASLISGCSTTSANLTPSEVSAQRKADAAVTGCIGVGALGFIVSILRKDVARAVAYAGIGCFAGAVAGQYVGSYIDARTQTYASKEARLDGLQRATRSEINYYRHLNAELAQDAARLTSSGRKQKISLANKREFLRRLHNELDYLEKVMVAVKADIQDVRSDRDIATLRSALVDLERQHRELNGNIGRLESAA